MITQVNVGLKTFIVMKLFSYPLRLYNTQADVTDEISFYNLKLFYRHDTNSCKGLELRGDEQSHCRNIFSRKWHRLQAVVVYLVTRLGIPLFTWIAPISIFIWCGYFQSPVNENPGNSSSEDYWGPAFISWLFDTGLIHYSKLHFSHLQNGYSST